MKNDSIGLGICIGIVLGMFFMGLISAFVNRDFEDLENIPVICSEFFNSEPASFDIHGEVVCENGMSANYRSLTHITKEG